RSTPQGRAEILQVVAYILEAVFFDQRVERIDGARVVVVEPGTENIVAAQLATMLMRNRVIRIIVANSIKAKSPDVLARQLQAGNCSMTSVASCNCPISVVWMSLSSRVVASLPGSQRRRRSVLLALSRCN